MSSIDNVFADRSKLKLMPFVPAGYPSLEATAALLPALAKAGAALIEVGIPFSDPIADGPVIQEAFTEALEKGVTVGKVLEMVAGVKGEMGDCPLVAMVSYSIAFRRGVRQFARECKAAGFAGLILPDLPPPEAQKVVGEIRGEGLDTVLLVAPSTQKLRRGEIAELSSGFIYYLSVAGTTGERAALPPELAGGLAEMRGLTKKPLCVGFGISKREHLEALAPHADGAIVGSALVKRLRKYGDGPGEVARAGGEFCRELIGGGGERV